MDRHLSLPKEFIPCAACGPLKENILVLKGPYKRHLKKSGNPEIKCTNRHNYAAMIPSEAGQSG